MVINLELSTSKISQYVQPKNVNKTDGDEMVNLVIIRNSTSLNGL